MTIYIYVKKFELLKPFMVWHALHSNPMKGVCNFPMLDCVKNSVFILFTLYLHASPFFLETLSTPYFVLKKVQNH